MRLKHLYISDYKNLKDLSIDFDGDSFIDIFVGKNGSGKSNLLEALIEIFRHLYEQSSICLFEYKIHYLIDGKDIVIEWKQERFYLNNGKRGVKTFSTTPLPSNVLIYYSGHNNAVSILIDRYEESFKKKIRGANIGDARKFIGIGPDCKSLLLSVLLLQPDACTAKNFIFHKLGIKTIHDTIKIEFKRPKFAEGRLKELGLKTIEDFDQRSHYWGADGITAEFLEKLKGCIKGEFNHSTIYNPDKDKYSILVYIKLFQQVFKDYDISEQFRLLDNLKTLGMLGDINISIVLIGGKSATLDYFSDGQLQSVYIYAVTEIFKDKECITLLDEPDSFLHPEWQFDFLKQVFEISEEATKTNHILMSSHSASTIISADEDTIKLFDLDGGKTVINKVSKSEVIRSLSAGLITFSESEARLNINHILGDTTGAVLFTEGITDEIILETAWDKLFPNTPRDFEIQNAFSCGFMRNLMKDKTLYQNNPGRIFFSLFDFDEAYNDWNQLGQDVQTDPHKCLVKKHNDYDSFALLLPVPSQSEITIQVINPHDGGNYGNKSLLTIEHLFYAAPSMGEYFVVDTKRTDSFIKFVSDSQKVTFAKEVVPQIDAEYFESFRPIFDFIRLKISELEY